MHDENDIEQDESPFVDKKAKFADKEKKKKAGPVKLSMVSGNDVATLQKVVGTITSSAMFKDAQSIASFNPKEIQAVLYSTGVLSLDKSLGLGGLLGGRILNCFGEAGTGKTLTAMTVGGAIQRAGGLVAFCDAEGTFSPTFATACGLDVSKLIYIRSTPERVMSGEDFFEIIRMLVAQGVHFIIVDSGAALVPSQKLQAQFGEGQQAVQARLFSEELQKLTGYLSANQRSIVWFTNQLRTNPMQMFGPKDGSTGGKALEFYASYNFQMNKVNNIVAKTRNPDGREEERNIGVVVKLTVKKNKTAPLPIKPIEFEVFTEFATLTDGTIIEPGINTLRDYFQVGKDLGYIEQSSSWYTFGDAQGNGEKQFCKALKEHPADMEKLRMKVLGIAPSAPPAAPAEPSKS